VNHADMAANIGSKSCQTTQCYRAAVGVAWTKQKTAIVMISVITSADQGERDDQWD